MFEVADAARRAWRWGRWWTNVRPRRPWSLLAILGLLAVVGCGGGEEHSATGGKPRDGGRLVIGLQQEPDLLNNILQLRKSSRLINNALFSRFVTYDDSLRLIPDLITEIPSIANGGVRADHLQYTYHLRRDAKWHDGQPLTAADVVFTWEIIMDPDAGAESQAGWDIVERIETPDAYTVVFHLSEPYANFVEDTFYDEDVLPKHLLQGTRGKAFAESDFHRAPIGSGPFRFVEWVPGSHITLKRFDEWHGDTARLDELVFKIVPEVTALSVQLRAGEIDGCDNADVSQLAVLQRIPHMQVFETPSMAYTHVTLQCKDNILDDVRVRRALSWATIGRPSSMVSSTASHHQLYPGSSR